MNKASLIGWSGAPWAETWRKGENEPRGHLRKSVSGQGSSQCKGPMAATCLVCARTARRARWLEGRVCASKSQVGNNMREVAKVEVLFSEWPGSWWKEREDSHGLSYSDMAPSPCTYLLALSLSYHPVAGIISHCIMDFHLLYRN